jgi:hypothetical protein
MSEEKVNLSGKPDGLSLGGDRLLLDFQFASNRGSSEIRNAKALEPPARTNSPSLPWSLTSGKSSSAAESNGRC